MPSYWPSFVWGSASVFLYLQVDYNQLKIPCPFFTLCYKMILFFSSLTAFFPGGLPPRPPMARFARAFVCRIYLRMIVIIFGWRRIWSTPRPEGRDPREVSGKLDFYPSERSEPRGGLGGWAPREEGTKNLQKNLSSTLLYCSHRSYS